jgi:hypothetical protein
MYIHSRYNQTDSINQSSKKEVTVFAKPVYEWKNTAAKWKYVRKYEMQIKHP